MFAPVASVLDAEDIRLEVSVIRLECFFKLFVRWLIGLVIKRERIKNKVVPMNATIRPNVVPFIATIATRISSAGNPKSVLFSIVIYSFLSKKLLQTDIESPSGVAKHETGYKLAIELVKIIRAIAFMQGDCLFRLRGMNSDRCFSLRCSRFF